MRLAAMVASLCLAAMPAAAVAQSPATAPAAPKPLTLEAVFGSPDLSGPRPRLAKLAPDGSLATVLRARPDDRERFDLWAIDAATGQARMLVDSAKVGTGAALSEAEKMRRERARLAGVRGIVDYDWAPDGRSILVPLDGDLYLADRTGSVRRLTATAATETDARVSPGGRYVAFVRDHNLFAIDLTSGAERALTTEGKDTLSWGVAEFVAQEEMDRTEGYWWAPGDGRVAVARVDEAGVLVVPRAAIGAEGTRLYEQRYPKAGTPNAVVQLWLMNPDGGGRVQVDLGPDPDIYLARVDWAKDGSTLYVQRQSRDQKTLDLLAVDPATGTSRVLLTERSPTWVNLTNDLKPLKGGGFLWSSERTGFRQLYRWQGGKLIQLTRARQGVSALVGVDEAGGRVAFTAVEGPAAGEKHVFAMPLGGGAPVRLTLGGGWHEATASDDGTRLMVTRSAPGQPPQVAMIGLDGARLAWIEENRLDAAHQAAPYAAGFVAPRFGTIAAADGTPLGYRMLVPPGLKPGERAPVFVQVYGGPGVGRQTRAEWIAPLQQYLVSRGWIVFSLDNRGTPDRGRRFEDALHLRMGSVEVEDQLRGLAWLKGQPFVDPQRIGVYGWSYGGYMVLRLLQTDPTAFAAGVSGAPVTDWRLYDTHYTERYMGMPAEQAAAYDRSSVLTAPERLTTPLLLIHGMADDNVVFEHSTRLMAAMQQRRLPFETMVYPGQTHAISNADLRIHMWRTIEAFMNREVRDRR